MQIQYRPEVDGLRAIAVIAVVLYHAAYATDSTPWLSGGFLGVDVFFVISGYLITAIIVRGLDTGSFRFRHFYQRRIRRILPPLLLVLLATIPLAWLWVFGDSAERFAQSVFSTLGFVANINFWLEDSYIAEASRLKPLLHTWSLAVEEQFYLLYPALLWLAWRTSRKAVLPMLVMIAAGSFIWAVVTAASAPETAFFLLHTRAWELAVGAMLVFLPDRSSREDQLSGVLAWGACLLIVLSFFWIDHQTLHPSWMTLIPVLATAAVIRYAQTGRGVARVLGAGWVVSIGLLSYSWYLWHFPTLALWQLNQAAPLETWQTVIAVLFSLVLAAISFRYIERIARDPQTAFKHVFATVAIGVVLTIAMTWSLLYRSADGVEGVVVDTHSPAGKRALLRTSEFARLHQPLTVPVEDAFLITRRHHKRNPDTCRRRHPEHACQFGAVDWISVGDSYAGQLQPALKEALGAIGLGLLAMSYEQCPLMDDAIWFGTIAECPVVNELRWQRIESMTEPKVFVVASNAALFGMGKKRTQNPLVDGKQRRTEGDTFTQPVVYRKYRESIQRLLQLGHQVVVIHNVPRHREDAKALYLKALAAADDQIAQISARYTADDSRYRATASADRYTRLDDHPNLINIYPRDLFCPESSQRRCQIYTAEGPVYNSGTHLSYWGAKRVVDAIFQAMAKP